MTIRDLESWALNLLMPSNSLISPRWTCHPVNTLQPNGLTALAGRLWPQRLDLEERIRRCEPSIKKKTNWSWRCFAVSLLSKETRCPGLRRLLKVCVVIFLRSRLALLNTSCFSLFGTQGDVKSVVSVERVREQEAGLDKLNMGIVFWKCCIKFRQMSGVVSPFGAVALQWSCCIWNDPQGKKNIHTKGKKIFILFHVVAVLKAFFWYIDVDVC